MTVVGWEGNALAVWTWTLGHGASAGWRGPPLGTLGRDKTGWKGASVGQEELPSLTSSLNYPQIPTPSLPKYSQTPPQQPRQGLQLLARDTRAR